MRMTGDPPVHVVNRQPDRPALFARLCM